MGRTRRSGYASGHDKSKVSPETELPCSLIGISDTDELVEESDCPVCLSYQTSENEVEASAEGCLCASPTVEELQEFLTWWQAILDRQPHAHLKFAASLPKQHRAVVHKLVEDQFEGSLVTVSCGVGDDRHISVYKHGHQPLKDDGDDDLNDVTARAKKLYAFTRARCQCHSPAVRQGADQEILSGMSLDEIKECMRTGQHEGHVRSALAHMDHWLPLHGQVMAAVADDDGTAIQELAHLHPGIIQDSIPDILTGDLPLHVAAKGGKLAALRALCEAGAPLEATDAKQRTALMVSRAAEETDAEAILLQSGAHDPDAQHFPLSLAAVDLTD